MAQAAVMERAPTYTNLAPEARCLYDIYKKEGDVFYCRRKYKKALLSYNEALRLANHSAQTLVARSRCYMGIGMLAKALEDTEAALGISNTYLPAVYQKAQILYRQGNYEMALMMFNRGHKLNPSAPGFLEGVQKAQHAMDILTTGRNMKTTVVGDLSFYVPKKVATFNHSRRPLPGVGRSHESSKHSTSEVRLPSPGFPKRHGMLLVKAQKRQPPVLSEASYGREGKRVGYLDDRAMREILGQLYDDKQYFERILNSNSGHKGDDLSGMLNSVLEDGLKFLYDRVLFWAQNGSLPPVAPHPAVVAKHYMHLQQQGKMAALDAETNSGEMSDAEESEEELIKVNQAIDAVSSVNDPDSMASRRKKKLLIRKRRADILRKRASMVVVTKKKPKKNLARESKENVEEEAEQMTPSRIQFHFSSLLTAAERDELKKKVAHTKRSLPEGSKVSWEDDSATESGLTAVDDREEERQRQRATRRLRKQQQREAERKKQEEEAKEEKDKEPKEDPLADYLDKVMNTMEELYQKGDMKALKLKAESFLLTMERYDPSIVGTKMAYLGRAHSYLGNAHLGFRHYDFALMHHEKDLEIGQRWKIPESQSRALGNIGRTHISTKKYSTALKYLAQKSKMVSEPKETAWLFHEIAGCFLQLHHYRFAQDAVSKALVAAQEANDSLYLMQASVLQGAILVKLQQYEKAYSSFEQAMEYAKLRDDKRAQQAITEALAEVNEKIAQQAKEKQNEETSELEAIEGGMMGQNESTEQEQGKQLDAIQEQQEAEANSAAGIATPREAAVEGEQDNNEKMVLEEEAGAGKKSSTVSAGSAANTGEDPELLALVSDEENEQSKEEKHKKIPEKDNKAKDKKQEKKETKLDEKAQGKEDMEKVNTENDDIKKADQNTEGVNTELTGQLLNEKTGEPKASEEDQKAEENNLVPENVKENEGNADKQETNEPAAAAPQTEKESKDENEDTVNSEEQQEKKEDKTVKVVVSGAEESAVVEANENKDKVAEMDKASQDIKTTKDTLTANAGPEATYKGRPITADSLAKFMAKDKGLKHEPDQTVVELNNSISREASRLETSSENKQDKKVTITEVEEKAEKKKDKDEEREKAIKSPEEPRGKDPVTDKLEDDLKLMAQDFNEKEFDSVIKRGSEIMKTLKKAKNIDAWSKRRLRNFARVHSYLGSANSEKQNFEKARMHHNADLKIGEAMKEPEIQSRALEHLGRTFIFENKLEKALEFFAKRAHLPRDTEDTARLFHEIANCFFQLKAYEFAKDAALVSLKAANEGGHTLFQLQSSVLIAVMKVKLNRVDTAFETFEEAMKYAVIRDDHEAAEAIRGAMKQIEDRVAGKVRDKWLAKIGKKPTNAQSSSGTSSCAQPRAGIEQEQPQIPTVSGIIKSLEEKEEEKVNQNDGSEEAESGQATLDAQSSSGKKDGSDTHRSEFLDAPDGALEHKQSAGERVVKIDLPQAEESTGFGPKKASKKKTNTAAKSNAMKKLSGKEIPPKNATEQALGIYAAKKTASKDDSHQKASIPKGAVSNTKKVTKKNDTLTEPAKPTATLDTNNEAMDDNATKAEDDQTVYAETETTGEAVIDTATERKNAKKQDTSSDAGAKVLKPRKSQVVKPSPGFYDHTQEEEVANRAKLRHSYVAPKPKVKSHPAVTAEEEELAKQEMMERRKSQRFIGLDPEKVAQAKANPPKPMQEEEPLPPKPKLERFVGLRIKQGWKPPRKRAKTDQGNESETQEKSPRIDVTNADDEVAALNNSDEIEPHETLMVPSVELLTPQPRLNDSHTEDGDVGYDANMPSTQMMIMNEELPMLRKDSVGSRPSRPATRLSLAEMVKDDTEVTPKGASKAELSALNALVQDSIRQDSDEKGKTSPPKFVLKKPEPTFREKRLAEEKAAMERARRRRFLANQKASFILMLTSPYAEVPSLKNRRNSQWFPLLRKRNIVPNLAVDTSGGDSGIITEDVSPRKNYDEEVVSPRKHVKQSEKDVLPRRTSKKDLVSAVILGEDASASEKHRLAIAAKEIRRQERETRREERRKLQEAEKRRRQQEREESELLKLTPRANYPNPYNKPPHQIPGLEHHYMPSPEDDNMELQWRREGERMLRREKLRAKREKEIQRLSKEEARKRKFEQQQQKKTGVSPRDKQSQEKDEDYTPDSAQLEVSPELTPEYDVDTPQTPHLDETVADDNEKEDNKENNQGVTVSKEEKKDEGQVGGGKKKAKEKQEQIPLKDKEKPEQIPKEDKEKLEQVLIEDKEKPGQVPLKDKEKPEQIPKEDKEKPGQVPLKDKENSDKKQQEEPDDEDDYKEEKENNVDEEFDGYNDDEEDKEDEIAIHIEREARQMKEDYNKGEIDAVVKRGTDLLKSLRKHIDIVSWSRRRLRWFGVAHSYMGSAFADKGEHDKAKSHHQADFRIGEALGEPKMQARALEHLARISITENQIPKALEYLAKRAHLPRDSETSARLFLDMGNCFLQMGALEFARDAAIQGLTAAKEGRHGTYQLQSSLLIAVCQTKLRDFDDAKSSFESALAEARNLNDVTTEASIQEAIEQLEVKRATMVRDKWKGKKGGVEPTPITEAIQEDEEEEAAAAS